MLGILYFCAWTLLLTFTAPQWMIAPGLRFGALMLARPRYWPWLIGAEWLAHLGYGFAAGDHGLRLHFFLVSNLSQTIVVAACVAGLRRFGIKASLHTPETATQLLTAALLTAFINTAVYSTLGNLFHSDLMMGSISNAVGIELLREYLGCLLIVPVLILFTRGPEEHQTLPRLLLDTVLILLPVLTVLLIMLRSPPPLPNFAHILALAPVLLFAFRNGWAGAALSMILINGGMMLFTRLVLNHFPATQSLLFLAVAGTGALLLGAASDALRRSSQRLSLQNARLEGANLRLDQLAKQLSEVARRNLRTEELQRRYVAAELHDELGQNLTAIQTRVKLAQTRLREAGLSDVATSINDILAHMRAAVRRLLNNLRPTIIDEFGLARALEEGPVHDLLKAAGIEYRIRLHGNLQYLDEDTRITIYRVVQEAATNTVRHAMAGCFSLRLRSGMRQGRHLVMLDIRDDGVGASAASERHSGHGLQSMRDRVTALGGTLRIHVNDHGTRLRILLPANGGED